MLICPLFVFLICILFCDNTNVKAIKSFKCLKPKIKHQINPNQTLQINKIDDSFFLSNICKINFIRNDFNFIKNEKQTNKVDKMKNDKKLRRKKASKRKHFVDNDFNIVISSKKTKIDSDEEKSNVDQTDKNSILMKIFFKKEQKFDDEISKGKIQMNSFSTYKLPIRISNDLYITKIINSPDYISSKTHLKKSFFSNQNQSFILKHII